MVGRGSVCAASPRDHLHDGLQVGVPCRSRFPTGDLVPALAKRLGDVGLIEEVGAHIVPELALIISIGAQNGIDV